MSGIRIAVDLTSVSLVRDGRRLLDRVTWQVTAEDRWVLLGPNGAGKTSLIRIASLWEHPTAGRVRVLGEELGRVDLRPLRSRIAVVSPAMADRLRPDLKVSEVVMTGRRGALEPWWHDYGAEDREATESAIGTMGLDQMAGRRFGLLSTGERQRVLLARALACDPDLMFLDEPAAGLDLGAREELVSHLTRLATQVGTPPLVLVTHHVEEVPVGFTHALLLKSGQVVDRGPLAMTITSDSLSRTFGLPVNLAVEDGRFRAWARI